MPADSAGQVNDGSCDDAGCLCDLLAGGVPGDGEAGPVGLGAGPGGRGVGDGGAQDLVGDQQGVDLLGGPRGGAGAQDPPAQDGGFQFQVGSLNRPPLMPVK